MSADLDVVAIIDRYLSPNLVPLLIALLVLLATTIVIYVFLRNADASTVLEKPKVEFRAYTREEVAKHNSPEDCWVTIKLKQYEDVRVFDVTSYVDEHPGGEAIYRNAGGDATAGFFGLHHPARAHDMIEEFMIGTLAVS